MGEKLKIGKVSIEMRSNEKGKCVFFGNHRCMSMEKNLRVKQKDLEKSKRCKGRKTSCQFFVGKSELVPKEDEAYLLPQQETEILTHAIKEADNALLVGPPGVGKSSLVLQLAAILNWGVVRYSCSEEITSSKIIGQWVVINDSMEWIDGYITHAMRKGLMLLEDESDFMRPELRGEVHSLMEQGGSILLTSIHPDTKKPFKEIVKKHSDFRWISTANTVGYGDDAFAFAGTQYMNSASRDRYEIIMKFNYRPPNEEEAIIYKKIHKWANIDPEKEEPILKKNIIAAMVNIANECREAQKDGMLFQFSIRRLLAWAKYYPVMTPEIASKLAIVNFCNETDAHTVKSLIQTHLNLEIS